VCGDKLAPAFLSLAHKITPYLRVILTVLTVYLIARK
jgi:hypothetical protein